RAISTGKCVSYDAEAFAIVMALGTLTSLPDATDIHIYADNKSALASTFDTSLHSSQCVSVSACRTLRPWLEANESRIHLHWCPGHVGVEQNELADGDVKDAAHNKPPSSYRSHAFLLQGIRNDAMTAWRSRAKDPKYRGKQFLTGRGSINLSDRLKTKNTLLDLAGGSNDAMARLTRATLNHAPTGEFRLRFHPREPTLCDCAPFLEYLHSRHHILYHCSRYVRQPNFHNSIRQAKDPVPLLYDFLDSNPNAFSF
ncbi:hypothetical protein PENSPDRAFT_558662, partial [Peniophora sp. CONT]